MKTVYRFIIKDTYPFNLYLLLVLSIITYSLCVERRYYRDDIVNGKLFNKTVRVVK